MAIEIERKFLVKDDGWRRLARPPLLIRQGYLGRDPERVVRVRRVGEHAYLTIKGTAGKVSANALLRMEFEYDIPVDDAVVLLDQLCLPPVIEKRRYLVVEGDGKRWEVDEFIFPHPSLVMAEIELAHSDEPVAVPSWVGREVTQDRRYSNNNIATAVLD